MTRTTSSLIVVALALFLVLPASAQDHDHGEGQAHDNTAFIENYTNDFDGASKKLTDLAGAMPADMYGWRPAEGIRSVSEVYMHVAGANFALASALGVAMPTDVPENLEQEVTDKEQVLEILKKSQEHVHEALEMVMNEDLSGEVNAFGQEFTRYQVLMIISGHCHEHLGQSIAYGRSNNVTPPWSGGGDGGQ